MHSGVEVVIEALPTTRLAIMIECAIADALTDADYSLDAGIETRIL